MFINLTYNLGVISAKKKKATLGNPQAVDADGLLMDVDVQPVTTIHLHVKISGKTSTISFTPLLPKKSRTRLKNIASVKYAREFFNHINSLSSLQRLLTWDVQGRQEHYR